MSRRAALGTLMSLVVGLTGPAAPGHAAVTVPSAGRYLRQTVVVADLPAGPSTLTLAKGHPDHTGPPQPGVVDLDYVDVSLAT